MYSQISANKWKTVLLMIVFVIVVGGLGWLFSGILESPGFFIPVVIFAVAYAGFSYFASAKMAIMMTGAKPISKDQAPELYRIVENLSITAGLPMPKVYLVQDSAPNAFATGRDPQHGVVAVTTGLMEILEDEELEGVLAHELSHIGNYDIRVSSIVIALVTVIAFVSDWLLHIGIFGGFSDDDSSFGVLGIIISIAAALIAPLIATLLQLAVSRKREFLADASGALLTRYPDGLARALAKIDAAARPMRKANNATAHLFLANPFGKSRRGRTIRRLFSTHPPTEARIAALTKMGSEL